MEPPMSNSSMRHPDPDLDFDDTRIILQGAPCTIAAQPCPRIHSPPQLASGGRKNKDLICSTVYLVIVVLSYSVNKELPCT
jgi:hypothetical protein